MYYNIEEYNKRYKFDNNNFNDYGYNNKTKTIFNEDGYSCNNVNIDDYKHKFKKKKLDLRGLFGFDKFGYTKDYYGFTLKYDRFIQYYKDNDIDAYVLYARNILDDIFKNIILILYGNHQNLKSLRENIEYIYEGKDTYPVAKKLEFSKNKLLRFISYANKIVHDENINYSIDKEEIIEIVNYFMDYFRNFNFSKEENKGFNSFGIFRFTKSLYDENGKNIYGEEEDSYLFDENGYNKKGYDIYGFDNKGFNEYGFNRENKNINNSYFDEDGFDIDGYNRYAFNINSIHKVTKTNYDNEGYDINGFNKEYIHKKTKNKFNEYGFTFYGEYKTIINYKLDPLIDAISIRKMLKEFKRIDPNLFDDGGIDESLSFRFAKNIRHIVNNIIHESDSNDSHPFLPWEKIITCCEIDILKSLDINISLHKKTQKLTIHEKLDNTIMKNIIVSTLIEHEIDIDIDDEEEREGIDYLVDKYINLMNPLDIKLVGLFSYHFYNLHINLSLTSLEDSLNKLEENGYTPASIWFIKWRDR